jgi:hypothetical protein
VISLARYSPLLVICWVMNTRGMPCSWALNHVARPPWSIGRPSRSAYTELIQACSCAWLLWNGASRMKYSSEAASPAMTVSSRAPLCICTNQ